MSPLISTLVHDYPHVVQGWGAGDIETMLGKLTNKILGKKEGKPYSDIPIFESLDSIGGGLPLTTMNLKEVEGLNEGRSKTPTKEFPKPMSTRSSQKRARQALLGDKENVPKLPGALNVLDKGADQAVKKKKSTKTSYYDEKHGESEDEASVTVESVNEEESGEDSPLKKARVVDNRFETERALSKRGPSREVSFAIDGEDDSNDMDEERDGERYEEYLEDDDLDIRDVLFSKIRHGHKDWVSQYIQGQNRDVNKGSWARDDKGNTMLHVAVQNNHKKLASFLLKAGVLVNRANKKGMTALDYAEMYNFQGLAEFLMLNNGMNGRGA